MGSKQRIEVPGGRFHITNRGNGYADIFRDDVDYADFLRKLAEVVVECGWLCHAYCLMPNHYHLVVETPEANRAFGMHRLNGRWARWFNRRHGRVGHLFQGPYRDEQILRDAHLLERFRYLALNPVRRGLCNAPEDWPWSSYAATIGLHDAPTFLTLELVHSLFGPGGLAGFLAVPDDRNLV